MRCVLAVKVLVWLLLEIWAGLYRGRVDAPRGNQGGLRGALVQFGTKDLTCTVEFCRVSLFEMVVRIPGW